MEFLVRQAHTGGMKFMRHEAHVFFKKENLKRQTRNVKSRVSAMKHLFYYIKEEVGFHEG